MKELKLGALFLTCLLTICGCAKSTDNMQQETMEVIKIGDTENQPQPKTTAATSQTTVKATTSVTKSSAQKPIKATEPETTLPTEKRYADWKSAYSDTMNEFIQSDSYTEGRSGYNICNLNNDDIPEMILFRNEYEFSVYTFYDNKALEMEDMVRLDEIFYSEKYQLIQITYIMTYSHANVWYRITNGEVEEVASAVYIADENPDPEVPTEYLANREYVSKDQYEQIMEEYGAGDPSYQKCEIHRDFSNAFVN